jgi:hypothetical protein
MSNVISTARNAKLGRIVVSGAGASRVQAASALSLTDIVRAADTPSTKRKPTEKPDHPPRSRLNLRAPRHPPQSVPRRCEEDEIREGRSDGRSQRDASNGWTLKR